jgi:hypothetical protein
MAYLNKGINKAYWYDKQQFEEFKREYPYTASRSCVFISHQKRDTAEARKIADYIKDAGIDVYFDEYDKTLSDLVRSGNSAGVTKRITDGIDNSTHMLCMVSPNTKTSYWVPFEIGFAYEKTDLATLTLKGITDEDLPDYLKIKPVVRGTNSLNEYLRRITGKTDILNENLVKSHETPSHFLDPILDWKL